MTADDQKTFYDTCAAILGIPHAYREPARRRNRWNNRVLGNGRFPGFGLVQCFGETCARVVSQHGTRTFRSHDALYAYLRELTAGDRR